MSFIRQRYPVWTVVIFLSLCILWFDHTDQRRGFTCRAQLGFNPPFSQCGSRNLLDFFMTMNGNGEGYLLLSGRLGCGEEAEVVNDILDFQYEKKGGNYALHLRKQNAVINRLLPQFREKDLIIEIKQLDQRRYLLSSNNRALLVCQPQ